MKADWPFSNLQPGGFDLILADPPWSFKTHSEKGWKKSPQHHYECMKLSDIKALPVRDLGKKNVMLLLCGTAPMLDQQIDTLKGWGFTYKTFVAWGKRTRHGKWAFGPGYVVRSTAEIILIGTAGSPSVSTKHRNFIEGCAREHSRKPEELYAWAETYNPNARRVELFARQEREGWESWGRERSKFNIEGTP